MTQTHKNARDRRADDATSCMTIWWCRKGFVVASILFLILSSIVIVHNVSGKITLEDEVALNKILKNVKKVPNESFRQEIQHIKEIQDSVLDISPLLKKIAVRETREPQDLLSAQHGQCSDRGRTIEKALRYHDFDVRFVSVFSRDKTFTPEETLAIDSGHDLRSHALVEVKTSRGWMFVDTNARWIALDHNDNPVSLEAWKHAQDKEDFKWSPNNDGEIYWLLRKDYTIVYGLYTRHGLFYPPFTPYIPDVNLQTLVKGHFL